MDVSNRKTAITVSGIRFAAAGREERRTGLLGWASFRLFGGLELDGVMLRRSREGRLYLGYPAREDGAGYLHFYVRPIDDRLRRDLERQVIEAIRFGLAEDA